MGWMFKTLWMSYDEFEFVGFCCLGIFLSFSLVFGNVCTSLKFEAISHEFGPTMQLRLRTLFYCFIFVLVQGP